MIAITYFLWVKVQIKTVGIVVCFASHIEILYKYFIWNKYKKYNGK